MIEKANAAGGDVHRAAAAAPDRSDHGVAADRQPVRALPQLPRDRRPTAGRAGGRDAQARGPRPHPGRQARRRAPDPRRDADVGLDLPAGRRPQTTSRTRRRASAPGPGPAGSTRWKRPTTGCSTTTVGPCCWSRRATWRTTHWTPSANLLHRDDVVLGLGDGGAHYGMICDASYSTYFLAHWARDRKSGRFEVSEAVRRLTSVPARVAGLGDRGRIAVGYKADLNVIDHAALRIHKPVITHDLPAGGRRLDQTADGYVATIVAGEVIAENGVPTDARPGKLVRGRQSVPPDPTRPIGLCLGRVSMCPPSSDNWQSCRSCRSKAGTSGTTWTRGGCDRWCANRTARRRARPTDPATRRRCTGRVDRAAAGRCPSAPRPHRGG